MTVGWCIVTILLTSWTWLICVLLKMFKECIFAQGNCSILDIATLWNWRRYSWIFFIRIRFSKIDAEKSYRKNEFKKPYLLGFSVRVGPRIMNSGIILKTFTHEFNMKSIKWTSYLHVGIQMAFKCIDQKKFDWISLFFCKAYLCIK